MFHCFLLSLTINTTTQHLRACVRVYTHTIMGYLQVKCKQLPGKHCLLSHTLNLKMGFNHSPPSSCPGCFVPFFSYSMYSFYKYFLRACCIPGVQQVVVSHRGEVLALSSSAVRNRSWISYLLVSFVSATV